MSAPRWQDLLTAFVIEDESSVISEIAQELQTDNVKLLEVIEGLGPYLTSTEKHQRCRGTQLLSELLHELPLEFLTEKEVTVLIDFYLNRMKDHFTVAPHVLYGMVTLSWQPLLTDDCVVRMVKEVFSEVQTQSLQQGTRHNVYTILDNLLRNRLPALLPLGADFVMGFIQTMDSEKDPRCLVVAFRCHRIIAQNFPISVFAEELFEVVACYFPIDFTPPPNDPHQVTRADLTTGLRGALGASPQFAEFCFPLLLEKTSSSIPSAKLEALHTLAACVETYGAESLQEFLISLWSEIRREVFAPQSEALEEAALSALSALVATLSTGMTQAGKTSPLFTFIDEVFKDCARHLTEPELRLLYPSAKLLQGVAAGSDPACTKVIHKVIPILIDQFHKHPQVNQRRSLIDNLTSFFRITLKVMHTTEAPSPLLQHKEAVLPVLLSLLTDQSAPLRVLAVRATATLLHGPGLVTVTERHLVAEHLTNLILTDPDSAVREEAVLAAVSMVKEDMNIVKDKILLKLLQWIKEDKMEIDPAGGGDSTDVATPDKAEFIYKAIGQVSCEPDLIKTSAPQLLSRIANLDAGTTSPEAVRESQYTCTCLRTVTERGVAHVPSLEFLKSHLLPRIFVLAISGALADRDTAVVTQWDLVETLAGCVRCIMSNTSQSGELVATIVRTFMVGDLSSFSDVINNNSIGFQPLKISSPWQQTQLLCLLSAVVSSVRRENAVPQLDLLMARLQEVACGASHQHAATSAAKCLAALLNKLPTDDAVTSLVESAHDRLGELIDCVSVDDVTRQRVLGLWAWITKALVLRGHPAQLQWVNKLLSSLESGTLGATAAQGFHVVLHEFDDVMTTSMHANVRFMYRQRFFLQTSPQLVAGFNNAPPGQRVHYLTALSHLLRTLPKQVLATELPPLLPLLIQSLTSDHVSLQLSTVMTMAELLTDNPKLLVSHMDEIVPGLLRMASYKPNMKVRVTAARCLGMLTTLPPEVVFRHQVRVTRELGLVVGDHKRQVRKAAVEARSKWYLLNTPKK